MDRVGQRTVSEIEEIYLKERTYLPTYALDFSRRNYVESAHARLVAPREGNRKADRGRLRNRLLGTWALQECTSRPGSTHSLQQEHHPFGQEVSGLLIYSEAGYVSVQFPLPDGLNLEARDESSPAAEEHTQAAKRYLAYFGPFYIDEDSEEPVVHHKFTNCTFSNAVGQLGRRFVHFETVDDCDLVKLIRIDPCPHLELWDITADHCDLRLESIAEHPHQSVTYRFVVRKEMCGPQGFLHGGCTATLVDNFTNVLIAAAAAAPGRFSDTGVSRKMRVTFLHISQ
ncbi:uncharacterized protein BP01DRAFT_389351 [Aspergillus saccharolyticus JOP 1030-1]|uniref:Lipocalin-like domain-containing protein n=1 Tax=Aspergillus saccharolyticus JOP 1030-1 TaxID=1450539 RepID=A0A318ZNF4_9EURO|nr:hypothetical protein BP01DRAFT_389351 [Aspergillus saccharolyticus JOP 1030-1]PYH48044.1 hypothetical protein BP01DRAFT_389351 [Aspergillus saccharolyticus JOP 1030-1]